jgi:hypothetical protein
MIQLEAAYGGPSQSVFNLGDDAAMSGLLIAARRGASGEAGFLIFLMD